VRDILLRLAISPTALYTPIWSTSILDELQRNLREQVRLRPEHIDRLLARLRANFPSAAIDPDAEVVRRMPNQAGDRHVLATAVMAEARLLVTNNVRDFRGARWIGVRVQTPDEFLSALLDEHPDAVRAAVAAQAAEMHSPPVSVEDLIDRYGVVGMLLFADRLRQTA